MEKLKEMKKLWIFFQRTILAEHLLRIVKFDDKKVVYILLL